jgi:hypothetical protein
MTSCGEFLAFFVIREIQAGLSPPNTVNRLRDQGHSSASHILLIPGAKGL